MYYGALCSSLFIILKKHESSSSSLLMRNDEVKPDLNFSGAEGVQFSWLQKMGGNIWTTDFNGLQITEYMCLDTLLSCRFLNCLVYLK